MNITESVTPPKYAPQVKPDKDPNSMKAAIKAYNDEYLTGLTDEEKEKIKEETKAFLQNLKKDAIGVQRELTKEDIDAANNLVKGLLKKYGFKGNVEDYAGTVAQSGIDEYNKELSQQDTKDFLVGRITSKSDSVKAKFL